MPQGGVAWSAVLNVQIGNTAKHSPPSRRFEAVLDSGASQCLFHSDLAVVYSEFEKGRGKSLTGKKFKEQRVYCPRYVLRSASKPSSFARLC